MNIELLAPAGSPEALDAAIGEGADAVYLGLKDFNARLRSTNFTYAQFEGAMRSLRRMGKKVYVTVNTVFEQREADRMYQLLKYLANHEPDALIVQDFGIIALCKSEFPNLRLHASTQMNIASARGANALSRHGVSRVVLARELSLEELRSIKTETNLELEVFVHGALCISVSGICLFSSFLGGKSANRGMCTQACRRLYHKSDRSEGNSGYYFSSNDLQLLERVPDLAAAGIKALKIEGRMKSASYVGAVVSAYRLVVDAVSGGDEDEIRRCIEQGQEILRNDFARPKTQYLIGGVDSFSHTEAQRRKEHKKDEQNEEEKLHVKIDWLNPAQDGGTGISLGIILKIKFDGGERLALVTPPMGVKLSARDSVRIHHSDDSGRISQKLTFAEKGNGGYWISAPEGSIGDHVYLIQTKEMRKRYAPVITQTPAGKGPGRERTPFPQITLTSNESGRNKKNEPFPEELYVAVSRPEDFYILQSSRPKRVMLPLSRKNARYLLSDNKPVLPFKPAEMIITLDPWFPQSIAGYENAVMADEIRQLIEKGYHHYVVNNPGHFSMLRDFDKIKLIAGPWLYTFNSWSLSYIASLGVHGFISPLENNRQNLERTCSEVSGVRGAASVQKQLRKKFFITVFAWPPLFSIRDNLSHTINFNSFTDNTDESFLLTTSPEGSAVYPNKYFSIIDKIPFLKEAGFGRFIIDLSGPVLKKSNYKDLMRSFSENARVIQPLPHSSRFNWKDGFYKN
ncbi:MAG: U32 family peptidase [Treponema sp.]|nr:U32 family peptidase [Treponema sp.]